MKFLKLSRTHVKIKIIVNLSTLGTTETPIGHPDISSAAGALRRLFGRGSAGGSAAGLWDAAICSSLA